MGHMNLRFSTFTISSSNPMQSGWYQSHSDSHDKYLWVGFLLQQMQYVFSWFTSELNNNYFVSWALPFTYSFLELWF